MAEGYEYFEKILSTLTELHKAINKYGKYKFDKSWTTDAHTVEPLSPEAQTVLRDFNKLLSANVIRGYVVRSEDNKDLIPAEAWQEGIENIFYYEGRISGPLARTLRPSFKARSREAHRAIEGKIYLNDSDIQNYLIPDYISIKKNSRKGIGGVPAKFQYGKHAAVICAIIGEIGYAWSKEKLSEEALVLYQSIWKDDETPEHHNSIKRTIVDKLYEVRPLVEETLRKRRKDGLL